MSRLPDAYDLWSAHQSKIEAKLARLPKCYECDQPIQDDDCYEFNNELICPDCLNDNHKKFTGDYME